MVSGWVAANNRSFKEGVVVSQVHNVPLPIWAGHHTDQRPRTG